MKTKILLPVKQDLHLLYVGVGLIAVSLLIFLLPEWGVASTDGSPFGLFFLNYALVIAYLVTLCSAGDFSFKHPFRHLEPLYLLQVLAIISCYALNRQMSIFQDSATWLEAFVSLFCVALVTYSFRSRLPRLLNQVLLFVLGAGAVLWLYYTLYLLPFTFIGVLGILALGISLHTFVPLSLVFSLGVGAKRAAASDQRYLRSFLAGAAFPVLFAAFFLYQWHGRNQQINYYSNDYIVQENETLPRWVKLSQQLPADYLTERLMKTDLIYQVPSEGFSVFEMPGDNFGEVKRHDPLVMLAVFFNGRPNLDRSEKVKVLESLYDARHQAEQRLWSGNNLSTANVVSQVRLFPQYRLAYTEKVLSVRNSSTSSWNEEEAIYTFFLPEGSVVTSLSLWIDGREEKGYLTTKGKAQTAYNTIVGKEQRDPSVVHWQEGNRVSVRVFPCSPKENRQFKLGVTSPLRQEEQELVYDNIYFTGPSSGGASETSVIYMEDQVREPELPAGYRQTGSNAYKRQGSYSQSWEVRLPAPALAANSFRFGGSSYTLVPAPQQLASFEPQRLYLDINASWTSEDLEEVWEAAKGKPIYAWEGRMTQLTEANKEPVFRALRQQHYSLFPVHKIKEAERALLISKSNGVSPNLSDLKDTPFAEEMADGLQALLPVRVYMLSDQLSPYLKSLKELHVIAPMHGSGARLQQLLRQRRFISVRQQPGLVRLGESGLGIRKTEAALAGNAPDHLLRLFAYNHLLQQIGARYFCQDFQEEDLLDEAAQANIVSPVSSLIVLEQQADYDRFDIQKSKDSLGNASMHGSGAVPEPAEWFLIILALLVVAILTLQSYLVR